MFFRSLVLKKHVLLFSCIKNTCKTTIRQLGERIGVQRAQISKLEKGANVITLPTMSRVFQALGIATATLDLGIAGKIALW
jgi:transcriptional regulator with XRE-family HTH domain